MRQPIQTIFEMLRYHCENEVVEFKKAENGFDFDDLGKYFSALSNEANLRKKDFAWLVFGVHDKSREVVGTTYKNGAKSLQKLKHDLAQHTTGCNTFREIFELEEEGKRVLLFQIPPASRGIPVAWQGHFYGRRGESLVALDMNKYDEIRRQTIDEDWSRQIAEEATIEDLEPLALKKAREEFKAVHPRLANEVDAWDDMELLGRAGVVVKGHLTNSAVLLLGKPTSAHLISPAIANITWVLVDGHGEKQDYEHFSIPFLLTVDEALAKIRNLNQRIMPGGTLFPDVVKQYDEYSIREILHNCIAHQDYMMQERITMVESPDSVTFSNGGSFLPGTVQNAIEQVGPQKFYRNHALCQGMVNFNMIDTIGRGIRKVFTEQRKRFFPMPDFYIDEEKREVTVKIYGRIIDERYYRLLKANPDLSLGDCIALDAVQKHEVIGKEEVARLRKLHLIEGRYPNLFLSEYAAKTSDNNELKMEYIKNKSFNDQHFKKMIVSYLRSFGGATRAELNTLLQSKLSDVLSDEQKIRKIGNLLSGLKKEGIIRLSEKKKWVLVEV